MSAKNLLVRCLPGCLRHKTGDVVGKTWYHMSSPLCLAAIHAGLLKVSRCLAGWFAMDSYAERRGSQLCC